MSKVIVAKDVSIDTVKLTNFLLEARKHGWAGDAKKVDNPERPGFDEYPPFIQGSWNYRDSYAGTFYAPGQEIVRFNDLPVWHMAYSGGMLPDFHNDLKFAKTTFKFLRDALAKSDFNHPFRGPAQYRDKLFTYRNKSEGDITDFKGIERITLEWGNVGDKEVRQVEVFRQHYIGGLIVHKVV